MDACCTKSQSLLYCIVLYCIVLYCIVLYITALYPAKVILLLVYSFIMPATHTHSPSFLHCVYLYYSSIACLFIYPLLVNQYGNGMLHLCN